MQQTFQRIPQAIAGVAVTQSPEGLGLVHEPNCASVIWNGRPLSDFLSWIDSLDPGEVLLVLDPICDLEEEA